MTEKLKNFLEKQGINTNQNNQFDSENNEVNYEYTTDENRDIINQDSNNIIEDKEITTENQLNSYNESKNVEENDIYEQTNNKYITENEEEEEIEDELPLITLNFISICQCCKNRFDGNKYLPYLLKCGHFFCLNCIRQYFSDERGIICPSDGLVAKSINELKLLKNLIIKNPNKRKNEKNKKITKNNYENSDYYKYMKDNLENYDNENNSNHKMNNCRIHKNQKLTHIICDTNEIICVHCAFEMLKLNPNIQIKELKEKYNDLNNFIINIMNNSHKNIELIQNTIELVKKNKENEQRKIKSFYNNIIKFLENEKIEKMKKIENISKNNIHNLEQKLLIFNEIIEQGDEFQYNLEKENVDINQNYSSIINNYNNILKLSQSNHSDNFNNKLKYIKFVNKSEINIKEYLNKISNINIINRIIKFNKQINSSKNNENINNKLIKRNMNNTNDTSSIRYQRRIVKKQFNKKNISSENLMEKRSQYDSNEYYNLNSSVKVKNSDYLIKNYNNNSLFEQNEKTKFTKSYKNRNKTPLLNQDYKIRNENNKFKKNKNQNLLENYFTIKNNEKNIKSEEQNDIYLNDDEENIKGQKNSRSFNNLNILNNFYNLDYNRRSPINKDIKQKGYIDMEQMKLYKDSLDKLIPKQLKQMNFN